MVGEVQPHVTTNHDEDGQIKYTIASDKFNHAFEVRKSMDGFVFYEVGVTQGKAPAKLSGRYTTPEKARKAVEEYIRVAPLSKTVKRDRNTAARKKQKEQELASTVQPDHQEHIQ